MAQPSRPGHAVGNKENITIKVGTVESRISRNHKLHDSHKIATNSTNKIASGMVLVNWIQPKLTNNERHDRKYTNYPKKN